MNELLSGVLCSNITGSGDNEKLVFAPGRAVAAAVYMLIGAGLAVGVRMKARGLRKQCDNSSFESAESSGQ